MKPVLQDPGFALFAPTPLRKKKSDKTKQQYLPNIPFQVPSDIF